MKILISAQSATKMYGGIKRFVERYAASVNADTYILMRKNMSKPYLLDGQVVENVKKAIKGIKPDVVHIQSILDAASFEGLIDTYKGIPTVYFCHSLIEDFYDSPYLNKEMTEKQQGAQKELFEKVDKVVFFNQYNEHKALNQYECLEGKTFVMNHGIQKVPITKIEREPKTILYVGRLAWEKGTKELAEAYRQLYEKDPEYKLLLVGSCIDRFLLDKLKEVLEGTSYQWIDWVEQEELRKYYTTSSVLVIPSFFESFNLVALEGLSYGIPILMSDIPVFKEKFISLGLAKSIGAVSKDNITEALESFFAAPFSGRILPESYGYDSFLRAMAGVNKSVLGKENLILRLIKRVYK